MKLKKSLSQHLLKDKNLLNKLVKLAGIGPGDIVIEIGAGQGDLTRSIVSHAHFVHAIELDRQFREPLERLQELFPNVSVSFANVLDLSFSSLAKQGRVKVMGNIPYNITGDILFKLLSEMDTVESAHLTMQKEVGERLASGPCSRTYGALSAIFQLHASVKVLLKLKPSLFIPPPEVESAFVAIIFDQGKIRADNGLVDFIKACFRHKRKYLKHSLELLYGMEGISALYSFMDFRPSVRAEEIEPKSYERMYAFLRERVTGQGSLAKEDRNALL